MKPRIARNAQIARHNTLFGYTTADLMVRASSCIVLAILLAGVFYAGSSASSRKGARTASQGDLAKASSSAGNSKEAIALSSKLSLPAAMTLAPEPAPSLPGIMTFASNGTNCTTAQTDFNLGDWVCAKATGVPVTIFSWHVSWVDPIGFVRQSDTAIADDQAIYLYHIDGTATSVVNGETVSNVGTWRVNLTRFSGAILQTARFTVHQPLNPTADVFVQKFPQSGDNTVPSGGSIPFTIVVGNNGPDAAVNVHLVDSAPSGFTVDSFIQQPGGPACLPALTSDCIIASMANGERAEFTASYNSGGNAQGTYPTSATVSNDTTDPDHSNNTTTSDVVITPASGGGGCSFDCPTNVVATANATVDGNFGAFVSYPSATGINGNCGAISANPASGSFFAVGPTATVVITSQAGPGCSFTVTVVDTPLPTITCPSDKIVTAGVGGTFTFPVGGVGTPTTTGTGVTVTFLRSDNLPATFDGDGNVVSPPVIYSLTDPFPTGTTGITWTAVDSLGRTATCEQKIVVHAPCATDTGSPTVTAPPDINVGTGPNSTTCGAVLDDELGTATAHDDCAAVISSSGIPAGNLFPIGTTNVIYTATDGSGHTGSATQHVTVTDNTPPVIFAPPNASYVCASDVPAASPSQAHGPDIIVSGVPQPGPVFDNCGVASVTVSQTSTGAGSAASPLVITRTYTAIDVHGNSASAVQIITVIDPIPPTITCPANITMVDNVPGSCGALVNPGTPTASDNCGTPSVAGVRSDGQALTALYPLGNTTITWTATDNSGNTTSCAQTVNVTNPAPTVTITGPVTPQAVNTPVNFTATFTDNAGDNHTAVWTFDGSPQAGTVNEVLQTITTTHTFTTVGPHAVTLTVTDDCGQTATANTSVLIYAFATATGSFVIGDGNAAVGTNVTFWGAQWRSLNSLSGGSAPSSFKGFASNASSTPPNCGGTWTTGPGNSSNPPDSIPAYLGVFVSSSITKSGSTISGNILRMVVVQTNPGYASNPGHAGTGTVVAVICP